MKISDFSFSMEFRFETKIACFVTILCTQLFIHTFSQLTMTSDLLGKGPHIHISSIIFVVSMMLMNVFNSPYFIVNITVIPVHFYSFIFCFKFYNPIVDIIVNNLYADFLCSRKTGNKNGKTPQCYHLLVATTNRQIFETNSSFHIKQCTTGKV